MAEKTNTLGAVVAAAIFGLYILMFVLRIAGYITVGHWLASLQFAAVIPLIYLLIKAPELNRQPLYYIQICLFLLFLVVELLVDYIYQLDFRETQKWVISYVTFFFAATGGLLGIASLAQPRTWTIITVILYLVMAALAFISRAVTGI